jgi:hypothetical protein
MLKSIGMIGMFCSVILGSIQMPARADNAVVQTSGQDVTINGDNNNVIQVTNQINVSHPGKGGNNKKGNSAVVQDAYQNASVNGNGNRVGQRISQENRERVLDKARDHYQKKHND